MPLMKDIHSSEGLSLVSEGCGFDGPSSLHLVSAMIDTICNYGCRIVCDYIVKNEKCDICDS